MYISLCVSCYVSAALAELTYSNNHFLNKTRYQSILDINECMEGINLCEDICINTYGSYRCACSRKSFTLTEDGFHCQGMS